MTAGGHVTDQLAELLLGMLSPSEQAVVDAHLAACGPCRDEREIASTLIAELALGEPLVEPPRDLRDRVLASIGEQSRFADFAERVAGFLDIAVDRARSLLDRLDDPAAWRPMFPGLQLITPEVGPRLAGATVGVLRLRPGARFPLHRHGGDEEVLLLQGGYRDERTGVEYHPGDLHQMPRGSEHSYVGSDGADCLCIGKVMGTIEILEPPSS